jgi:predicted phosphodiesterase
MRAELIAIPDLHFPWAHDRAVRWVINEVRKLRPRYIVQLGDLYDQYCFSKFPRNPNVMTPREELRRGQEKARKFWHDITKASPDSRRHQLLGNHDVRIDKRIAERLPELQDLVKLDIYSFPDVNTLSSDRDDLELQLSRQKVVLLHGYMTQPAAHLSHFGKSVIFGHLHRPHHVVQIQRFGKPPLFELNAGYLADPKAPVFKYGGTVHKKWELGYGLVDHNCQAQFVGYPGK